MPERLITGGAERWRVQARDVKGCTMRRPLLGKIEQMGKIPYQKNPTKNNSLGHWKLSKAVNPRGPKKMGDGGIFSVFIYVHIGTKSRKQKLLLIRRTASEAVIWFIGRT